MSGLARHKLTKILITRQKKKRFLVMVHMYNFAVPTPMHLEYRNTSVLHT